MQIALDPTAQYAYSINKRGINANCSVGSVRVFAINSSSTLTEKQVINTGRTNLGSRGFARPLPIRDEQREQNHLLFGIGSNGELTAKGSASTETSPTSTIFSP